MREKFNDENLEYSEKAPTCAAVVPCLCAISAMVGSLKMDGWFSSLLGPPRGEYAVTVTPRSLQYLTNLLFVRYGWLSI